MYLSILILNGLSMRFCVPFSLDKWEGGVLRLELKGGDNSLRVRQIRVLGQMDGAPLRVARQYSTQTIQHYNTEAETLRVFRLITSQVCYN